MTFNLLFELADLEPFYLGLNKFKMDQSLKNFQSLCSGFTRANLHPH